jgi:hypothetical protein
MRASFTGNAAETFWGEALPDLIHLVPKARLLLNAMSPGTAFSNKLSNQCTDGGEDVSATPTAAMHQQRIASDPTAALMRVQASVRRADNYLLMDPYQVHIELNDGPE